MVFGLFSGILSEKGLHDSGDFMKKYTVGLFVCFVPLFCVGQGLDFVVKGGERTSAIVTERLPGMIQQSLTNATSVALTKASPFNTATMQKELIRKGEEPLLNIAFKQLEADFAQLSRGVVPIDQKIGTNLATPSGAVPLYKLPSQDGVEATRRIEEVFGGREKFAFDVYHRDFLVWELPILVVLHDGQITTEQLAFVQKYYRYPLQATLDSIQKTGTLALVDWYSSMETIINLGFFGTVADAPAMVEFAKSVPKELIPLTELNVVFALLNLGAYNELRGLAKDRAETEQWFDENVFIGYKRALNAHLAAFMYLKDAKDLPVTASMVHSDVRFGKMVLKPWIPQDLSAATKGLEVDELLDGQIAARYKDHLAYQLRMDSGLMKYLLKNDTLPAIRKFMSLKRNMQPPV